MGLHYNTWTQNDSMCDCHALIWSDTKLNIQTQVIYSLVFWLPSPSVVCEAPYNKYGSLKWLRPSSYIAIIASSLFWEAI